MSWKVGCWGHPGSNGRRIADRLVQLLGCEMVDFNGQPDAPIPAQLLMVTPTLGDAEVAEVVERFVLARQAEFREFAVIELGNYYGFDDWAFGCSDRVRKFLAQQGAHEVMKRLSLDTLPQIDWATLDRWCEEIAKPAMAKELQHVQ